MKYIVVGAGPTGLSLTYYLAKGGHEVTLIEKEDQLGGSWNCQWKDGKYFTENSPRILLMSRLTTKFLKDIGMKNDDFGEVYGSKLQSLKMFTKFALSNVGISDCFILISSFIKHKIKNPNITVQDWLDSKIFQKFKRAMKIGSIVVCDRPDRTNLTDFFGAVLNSLIGTSIKQMKQSNKWHQILESTVANQYKVTILKNTSVEKILTNKNRVIGVSTKNQKYYADRVVLATQSSGIQKILDESNQLVKNNWMKDSLMKKWSKNTYYSGFSFQLNFKEKVSYPNEWLYFSLLIGSYYFTSK